MEENQETLGQEQIPDIPRPRWQVWAARGAAVVFVLLVILQILQIAGAGRP